MFDSPLFVDDGQLFRRDEPVRPWYHRLLKDRLCLTVNLLKIENGIFGKKELPEMKAYLQQLAIEDAPADIPIELMIHSGLVNLKSKYVELLQSTSNFANRIQRKLQVEESNLPGLGYEIESSLDFLQLCLSEEVHEAEDLTSKLNDANRELELCKSEIAKLKKRLEGLESRSIVEAPFQESPKCAECNCPECPVPEPRV